MVQVQGKVRARLDVAPDISDADLEALAMADPAVVTRDRRRDGAQGDRARAEAGQRRRLSPGLGNLGAMPVVVVTDSTASLPARAWRPSAASSWCRCRW